MKLRRVNRRRPVGSRRKGQLSAAAGGPCESERMLAAPPCGPRRSNRSPGFPACTAGGARASRPGSAGAAPGPLPHLCRVGSVQAELPAGAVKCTRSGGPGLVGAARGPPPAPLPDGHRPDRTPPQAPSNVPGQVGPARRTLRHTKKSASTKRRGALTGVIYFFLFSSVLAFFFFSAFSLFFL